MPDQEELRFVPEITYAVFRKATPSWTLPRNVIQNYDLSYVVGGSARYKIDGLYYNLESGDLICTPPGSAREGATFADRPVQVYAVDFFLRDPENRPLRLPFPVKTRIGRKRDLIRYFNELSLTWIEKQPGYTLKIHGLLLLILHRLYELCVYRLESPGDDNRIRKAIRYIAANYPQKITVEDLAELTKLEPHYFNTLFKRKTGLSMHQYLIKTRIRNAYDMLLGGEYRVAEIAELCGYTDVYHFCKQFKTIMRLSPSQCLPRS
jgi:AraC-like DNA-binding protein